MARRSRRSSRTRGPHRAAPIPKFVVYNHEQPTLDTEAQQVADGSPDGWLFIDFCQTFEKLTQPLARTGKWDPAKSFGSDTLNDCAAHGSHNYPGMRATQANASSGASFPAFKALFEKEAKQGVNFQSFVAEAFDSAFIAFLAALEAKSDDPTEIAKHVVSVTNDPGRQVHLRAARRRHQGGARRQEDPFRRRDRRPQLLRQRPGQRARLRHLAAPAGRQRPR